MAGIGGSPVMVHRVPPLWCVPSIYMYIRYIHVYFYTRDFITDVSPYVCARVCERTVAVFHSCALPFSEVRAPRRSRRGV